MDRRFICSLAVLFIVCALFTGCVEEDAVVGGDASSVVEANNRFAFDLYSQYKSKEGNIFFSPYSISSALAMTHEGARGKTAEEMAAVFHFPPNDSVRRSSFAAINAGINKKDKPYILRTANALWAQKDFTFLPAYFNVTEKYYGCKVTNLDFVGKTEESRLTINSWVAEQTNDKIKDLIPRGAIDSMTRLVLTNAVYFKGAWVKQFNKNMTAERDFRVSNDKVVRAEMMSMFDERFNYTETGSLQVLELPYSGGELSMLIFLPKNGDLGSLEKSLSAGKLAELRGGMREEKIDELYLPKFRFESKYLMADTLEELGMPSAFDGSVADFSGMDGRKDLFIGQVIHQAFVEVNEEGTEAAAATGVVMEVTSCLSCQSPEKIIFNADHPFIFVIQQKPSGNILFMGRVADPSAA